MSVVELIFFILALLVVFTGFFPTWNIENGPVVTPRRAIWIVLGLVLLFLVYLVFATLFGQGPIIGRG